MAVKKIYFGDDNGTAREVKKIFVGDDNGVAREVKKVFYGDETGHAKMVYGDWGIDYTAQTLLTYESNPSPDTFKVTKYGRIVNIDLISEFLNYQNVLVMQLPSHCYPLSEFYEIITANTVSNLQNNRIMINIKPDGKVYLKSNSYNRWRICIHCTFISLN